jgi:hypothetical protein
MSFLDGMRPGAGFKKGAGVTGSERYLNRLCEHTFLSLWTYPAVFRDQGKKTASGDGKEVLRSLGRLRPTHLAVFRQGLRIPRYRRHALGLVQVVPQGCDGLCAADLGRRALDSNAPRATVSRPCLYAELPD